MHINALALSCVQPQPHEMQNHKQLVVKTIWDASQYASDLWQLVRLLSSVASGMLMSGEFACSAAEHRDKEYQQMKPSGAGMSSGTGAPAFKELTACPSMMSRAPLQDLRESSNTMTRKTFLPQVRMGHKTCRTPRSLKI